MNNLSIPRLIHSVNYVNEAQQINYFNINAHWDRALSMPETNGITRHSGIRIPEPQLIQYTWRIKYKIIINKPNA